MLNIRKNLLSESLYGWKSPYSMTPTRIVVHNTANDASAENEIRYMNKSKEEGGVQVSYHYAVDDVEAVQGLEENRNGWHAGDGANGKGNREGIAIEICYSKSGGDRFVKAEQNAVILIVSILRKYNWDITKVTKHQDYSGKYCPHRTLDMGWDRFIKMVENSLVNDGDKEKDNTNTTANNNLYTGNSIVDALKSIGVNSSFGNRKIIATNNGINNYTGTAEQNIKLLSLFKSNSLKINNNANTNVITNNNLYTGNSIVDALKSIGVDSSFNNRNKIAYKNGISNYRGTAEQNVKLLKLFKSNSLLL